MIQSIYNFWISWLGSLTFDSLIWVNVYDYMVHILSWATVGFALLLACYVVYACVRLIVRFIR